MKTFLLSVVITLTTSCSHQVVYDVMHERERQECLKQGHSDCPRTESYDKYKQHREDVMPHRDSN